VPRQVQRHAAVVSDVAGARDQHGAVALAAARQARGDARIARPLDVRHPVDHVLRDLAAV
jgi:hypothetical protein